MNWGYKALQQHTKMLQFFNPIHAVTHRRMISWTRRRCVPIFLVMVGSALMALYIFPSLTPRNLLPVSKFFHLSSSGSNSHRGVPVPTPDQCGQYDRRNDVIHVVTAGDEQSFAPMVTMATSVIVNTNSTVMFHFITFDNQVLQLKSVMESSIVHNVAYEIIPFHNDILKGQFVVRGPRKELANPLNFVRFYLPELLPCVDNVVYLDVDCVVLGNIKNLYTWPIQERHVAALMPENNKPADLALNFSHPLVRSLTIEKRTRIMSAGVFVANLTRWRAQHITAQLDHWMKLNVRTPLVKYSRYGPGSQAIFLLVLYDKYTPLDGSWNKLLKEQSEHEPETDSNLLHWSGIWKPWQTTETKNSALWWSYFLRSNSSLSRST